MLKKLKQSLLRGREGDTHTYQCVGCRKSFESTAPSAAEATCPNCGGGDVRVVVGGRDQF